MYKHILLPTDGSTNAERAASAAIALAAAVGARMTALHVLPANDEIALEGWAHPGADYAERLETALAQKGREYLEHVREAAHYAGVPCECTLAHSRSVHGAIVAAARANECDLIVMGSGVRADPAAILGSEAVQALARSNVAVLVHPPRAKPPE
jgi:nucleotide-binding universal stress UspA family protein